MNKMTENFLSTVIKGAENFEKDFGMDIQKKKRKILEMREGGMSLFQETGNKEWVLALEKLYQDILALYDVQKEQLKKQVYKETNTTKVGIDTRKKIEDLSASLQISSEKFQKLRDGLSEDIQGQLKAENYLYAQGADIGISKYDEISPGLSVNIPVALGDDIPSIPLENSHAKERITTFVNDLYLEFQFLPLRRMLELIFPKDTEKHIKIITKKIAEKEHSHLGKSTYSDSFLLEYREKPIKKLSIQTFLSVLLEEIYEYPIDVSIPRDALIEQKIENIKLVSDKEKAREVFISLSNDAISSLKISASDEASDVIFKIAEKSDL